MAEPNDITSLPSSLATLKRHVYRQLPLLDMRTKEIPLVQEKLPTETATRRAQGATGVPHETLHFFDPQSLFKAFMSSDIVKDMHIGMAHWVDEPTELWHARCWSSSIRTTSGQYAHFKIAANAQSVMEEPIFPSDFVHFSCSDEMCKCNTRDIFHIGRVYGVGLDHRTGTTSRGEIFLQVQQAFRSVELPEALIAQLDPPMHANEVILSWEETYFIPERDIHGNAPIEVVLDYVFGEDRAKRSSIAQEYVSPTGSSTLFSRRMVDSVDFHTIRVTPLCHTHPIRAELELREFGRRQFIEEWDFSKGLKCLSVPLLTFIDGFGLYRNSYRSLMGTVTVLINL